MTLAQFLILTVVYVVVCTVFICIAKLILP